MESKELDFEIGIERQWVSNGIRYCIYTAGITLIGVNVAVWSLVPFLYSNSKDATHRVANNCSFIFQSLSGVVLLIGGAIAAHDEPLARMEREKRRKIFAHRQAVQEQMAKSATEQILMSRLSQSWDNSSGTAQGNPSASQAQLATHSPNTFSFPSTQDSTGRGVEEEKSSLPPSPYSQDITTNVLRVLKMYNIEAQVLDLVKGPSTIALYVLPNSDSPATVAKIAGCAAELQSFLGLLHKPLISPSSKGIQIELPRPDRQVIPLESVLPFLPADLKGKMSMLVGVDINFEPVFGDLDEPYSAHWLVAGESGSGKSKALQSAALSLILRHPPAEVQLVIIDLKEETFPHRIWGNVPWLWNEPSYEPESALLAIAALNDEMERRKAVFRENGVSNFVEYCQLSGVDHLPRLVLFSDETSDLSSKKSAYKERFNELAEPAAQKWRSFGINWILALQRCTEDMLSRAVVSNLQARVCLKVIDGHNSKAAIGIPGGEELLGKGDILVRIAGTLTRVQSCYCNPEQYLSQYALTSPQKTRISTAYNPPSAPTERARWISQLADVELSQPNHTSTSSTLDNHRATHPPHSDLHRLEPLMHMDSTESTVSTSPQSLLPKNWEFPNPTDEISPHLKDVVLDYKYSGIGKIRTIKEVWGLERSGTDLRYKAAENQYKAILSGEGFEC
ncbi:FtsK/SpoIIIE domain-containing protein [Kamptonema animale CS-326]|jgi:DNA segregation ATPase FtsK/SpoIIIE-like protein|uniref:FtsK/SpoIIIE domain-containing protein n=1 Tax=Kamptonema animale TaxID=92934 RepID=UPI00232F780B|nr:FtsK/SpoIIIE domain-containing protein [Kamptonema animale]MDB9514108.1 FtsK/SpoIIIE domain-containing protein [Kamptonema animale CS-326]